MKNYVTSDADEGIDIDDLEQGEVGRVVSFDPDQVGELHIDEGYHVLSTNNVTNGVRDLVVLETGEMIVDDGPTDDTDPHGEPTITVVRVERVTVDVGGA